MLNSIFTSVSDGTVFSAGSYLLCTICALFLGCIIAAAAAFRDRPSKNFRLALIVLPAIVETVIVLVNGNLGTGIAVMGAFSLVRFRSAPGNAKEIVSIFLSMAVGLATAAGYLGIAVIFTLVICAAMILLTILPFFQEEPVKELRITVPESLNFAHEFDDLFESFTKSHKLQSAKTTNMGSLYKLQYSIVLKDDDAQQKLMDSLRCRNGNLEIAIGVAPENINEL